MIIVVSTANPSLLLPHLVIIPTRNKIALGSFWWQHSPEVNMLQRPQQPWQHRDPVHVTTPCPPLTCAMLGLTMLSLRSDVQVSLCSKGSIITWPSSMIILKHLAHHLPEQRWVWWRQASHLRCTVGMTVSGMHYHLTPLYNHRATPGTPLTCAMLGLMTLSLTPEV